MWHKSWTASLLAWGGLLACVCCVSPPERLVYLREAGGEVVLDLDTALMWQKAHHSSQQTWDEATAYCETLQYTGYGDWRLPDREELRTLVGSGFEGIPPTEFWTVETDWQAGCAWYVHFRSGTVGCDDRSLTFDTRCVR